MKEDRPGIEKNTHDILCALERVAERLVRLVHTSTEVPGQIHHSPRIRLGVFIRMKVFLSVQHTSAHVSRFEGEPACRERRQFGRNVEAFLPPWGGSFVGRS